MTRMQDPRVATLSQVEVLTGTSVREREQICRLTTEVRLPAGRVLCKQGEIAREVFLLVEGQIAVRRSDVPLGVVGRGGIIGEMALVEHQVRSATTIALTDVTLLVLSTGEFAQLLACFPVVARNVHALTAVRTEEIAGLCAA